jgi:hypothetical protein
MLPGRPMAMMGMVILQFIYSQALLTFLAPAFKTLGYITCNQVRIIFSSLERCTNRIARLSHTPETRNWPST